MVGHWSQAAPQASRGLAKRGALHLWSSNVDVTPVVPHLNLRGQTRRLSGDEVTDTARSAVGRVEVSTRCNQLMQFSFQDSKFTLPPLHVFEFCGEQG